IRKQSMWSLQLAIDKKPVSIRQLQVQGGISADGKMPGMGLKIWLTSEQPTSNLHQEKHFIIIYNKRFTKELLIKK
ncbi:hypothetical protein Mgra_00009709, partial [Meloidogyne graminicola]